MKQKNLLKILFVTLITLIASPCLKAQNLTAGDLAIIGVGVDSEEVLLVALADIPSGESVFFTDDEWAGSAFKSGEGFYEWVTPTITAGNTITLTKTTSSVGGTITQRAGSMALGNSGDGFFLYQTTTNVFNTGDYTILGFAGEDSGDAGTLAGTGLVIGEDAVYFAGDNGIYSDARTANSKSGHLANIYDNSKWTTSGTAQTFDTSSFTVGSATVGITLGAISGSTKEDGTTAIFTAVLDLQPATNVVLNISSGDTGEVTLDLATLTFTNADWDTPQTVTATGVDDALQDGSIIVTITVAVDDASSDDDYDAVIDVSTTVTNEDDDFPDIVITEVMYNTNTPGNDDEWIELYNDDNSSVDINGWTLDYASSSYTFSAATVIPSKSYITIAVGSSNSGNDFNYNADFPFEPDFNTLGHTTHSALVTTTAAGDTNKLTNKTATITLKNASATVIDTVTYDDADTDASHDGSGNSLEIIDVNADNSDPTTANWRSSSNTGGSPGASITSTWIGSTSEVWNLAGNWDNGIPTSTINAIIPVIVDITKRPTAIVDISAKYLIIESGASLIVKSNTVNAEVTYKANISDTNWHLMSSPVVGEQYNDDWNTLNFINVSGTVDNNDGVSTYDNTTDADGNWDYFQTGGATTTFDSGKGYSLKRTASGDYRFTGTFPESDITSTISQGFGGVNKWNFVGNPFPSYIKVSELIAANSANLTDTHEFVYVWNGTNYVTLESSDYIHTGQAFFVNAANSTADNFTITESLQSHQTGITFYRETSNPKIKVFINDNDNNQKFTEIRYAENTTKALDPGFDAGTFTGQSSSFSLFSHLVSNSEGVDFMIQSLPKDDYENTIIPLGLNADAGKEITFTADALNVPSGLKVFLEDRQTNIFTRLDEANSEYKITLTETLNGVGRFYMHTTASVLSTEDIILNSVRIFKTDASTLKITGLPQGKTSFYLYNILGKEMMTTTFTSNGNKEISLSKLTAGIYLAKMQTEKGAISKKIILE